MPEHTIHPLNQTLPQTFSLTTTHESPAYEKRGYLNHEFRLFHLRGQMNSPISYHYHDFHKVLILLNGEADYIVEGRSYHLRPLDIVLVGAHCLHKPVVPDGSRYERIILYLSPECLDAFSSPDCALDLCFQLAKKQQSDVLRLGSLAMTPLLEALSRLENAYQRGNQTGSTNGADNTNNPNMESRNANSSYGSELLLRLLFLEFMVHLDRAASENHREYVPTSPSGEKILELMRYLSEHPEEEHTIDQLAARFYLSKYHMMRLFRQETGYTITEYLTEKRLQNANGLLRRGTPVTEACYQSGFRNYAAFLRAYKKKYHDTPRTILKTPISIP